MAQQATEHNNRIFRPHFPHSQPISQSQAIPQRFMPLSKRKVRGKLLLLATIYVFAFKSIPHQFRGKQRKIPCTAIYFPLQRKLL